MTLREHEIQALMFLRTHPGDEVGIIETEEQLAAALVYSGLMRLGLVGGSLKPGDGGVFLTVAGEFAIAELERETNH